MKLFLPLFLILVTSGVFASDDPRVQKIFKLPAGVNSRDYLPNKLIIKYKADSTLPSVAKGRLNGVSIRSVQITGMKKIFSSPVSEETSVYKKKLKDDSGLDRIYEFTFEGKRPIDDVINELLKNESIEYAEPSYIYYTQYTPNDAFFVSRQSYLNQVKATQAWDMIRNSSNVVIGIVDSGSDLDHPDLTANIFINSADPVNGIDDDRDGYIDNNRGWDLIGMSASSIKEDNDPSVTSDSTDHGVHVSGIAAAVSDNATGVSSISFNAKLLIVKVGADDNSRAIYRGYEGIKYAADHGAQIINCSWGGPGGGAFGQDVVNYAIAKGCLIVAAAGNDNTSVPDYPASYPAVVSVASVGSNDLKSSFSNYGSTVDISAPGSAIYNTRNNGAYGSRSGTSMSAPMLASAAALVKAKFPDLTMLQVGEQLRITSDRIDDNNPSYAGQLGKGRLNVLRAVNEASPSIRNQNLTVVDKGNGAIPAGDTIKIYFDIKNFLAPASGLVVNLSTTNTHVQIIDSQINIGSLGTLETKTSIGPFRVFVRSNASDNEEVQFKLSYTSNGGNYNDFEIFNVIVSLDYLNIEVNNVSSTVTSNGRIGYSSPEAVNGIGFAYKGQPMLYEASLMIGNSPARVSNNARNDVGQSDEHFVKRVRVGRVNNSEAAFEGRSEFDDSMNPGFLNIYVKHRQLAYTEVPDDKYIIAEYEVFNENATPLTGVYIGLFSDWDIDENSRDITHYDEINRMGYVYGKAAGTKYAGVKLLKSVAPAAYYPMSYQVTGDPLETGGGFSLAEKYETLSSGIKSSGLGGSPANGYDVMFVMGSGPYDIPANGSVKVAFAIIGGDNLQDLQTSATAAESKYNSILNPGPLPDGGFSLKQNYPNPANQRTTIEFSVPKAGATSLSLFNSMGKHVKTILSESLREGSYRLDVDVSTLTSGMYFCRMNYDNQQLSIKMLVVK
ncbi:S8 family serine peptidase [Flavihumibacter sp. R14]|nr:S8 family serine peptidase [Flavihumibacter soli]